MSENQMEARKDIFPRNEKYPDGHRNVDVMSYLTRVGETLPRWWSKRRDSSLRAFWKQNDQLSGSLYAMVARMSSIPLRVEARDKSIVSHVEQAAEFNKVFQEETVSRSDPTQKGWPHVGGMFYQDHFSQDNGAFMVIDGPGRPDGPLAGRPTRLIHLDAWRVTRKGNPEFPITYHDWDGKEYKIHHSRVIAMSSMASPKQSMYGVGVCAVSRCANYAQILADQGVYKQEKLGSRPKERVIIGKKGITAEDIAQAFYSVDQNANAQGLRRYAKTAVIAPNERSSSSEIDIEVVDMVQAGDVFNEETSLTLGMYTIALAFGIPARWLWPATASGATKADAQYSHLAGMVQGPAEILRNLMLLLDDKFLPPQLMMYADYQDDEQDRQQADIRKTRAEQRKTDIEDEVITIRVAREQALAAGDITQEQFNDMELEDGRLPSGDPVVSLFNTRDAQIKELLVLGVENALDIDANDPVDMIIAIEKRALEATRQTQEAPSAQQKRKARLALGALGELKVLYEQKATDETAAEVVEEMNLQAQTAEEERQDAESPTEQPEKEPVEEETEEEVEEVKAFNFGARAGEIIGGGLARDPEGKFISAEAMGAAIRARLLEKIRGRKNEGKSPEENRAAVLAEMGDKIPAGGLDALSVLGDGGIPDDGSVSDQLVEMGLARVTASGQVKLSSSGASVLIAANSGSARRTQEALIRAQAKAEPKAKKPSGGKPKEEKPDKEQVQAENRASVAESTGVNIESLNAFSEGQELDADAGLAQDGLVEFDSSGTPRLTSAGRSMLRAANNGDSRAASDTLSRARENVQKKRDKAEKLEETATEAQADIDDIDSQIAATEDAAKIASLEEKKAKLQEKIAKANAQAQSIRDSIGETEEGVEEEVEEDVTEEVEKTLVSWIKRFFGRKSQGTYEQGLKRWMRFLWRNPKRTETFESEMFTLIQDNLTSAWKDGLSEIGFTPDETTLKERQALEQIIKDEQRFIPELTEFFEKNSQAEGVPFADYKVSLWGQRFADVKNKAKTIVGKDLKYEWVLGEAEHCKTCAKLAGKVKRGSYWATHVTPQNPPNAKLDCKGFECKCELVQTTNRQSSGTLGSLP